MFDPDELAETLELQRKSYELLKWVGRNLQSDTLDFRIVHEVASSSEAAREWMTRHWHNLPRSVRPLDDQLDAFAHLFSSFLITSFKLVENPGQQQRSYCRCWCSYCTFLGQADRLQVKSPSKGAKRSGEELKRVYLVALAAEQTRSLTPQQVDQLTADSELREPLAMATYARELIRRTMFASQGEGVLALWRQFAWSNGSPKKKFTLKQADILAAERCILAQVDAV